MRLYLKLTALECKLFVREPISLVFIFAFPVVVLVVLFGVFGSQPSTAFNNAQANDYYQSSYLAVVIGAMSLVALPVHVASYRERGVLRRMRASSVPASAVLTAQVVVSLALITVGSALLVAVGMAVYDTSLPLSPRDTAIGFALSAASFLAVGFLIGNIAPTARAAQAIGMLAFFPMWLLSGAGPPRDLLSEGMRQIGHLLPLTYAVRAIQDPWLGHEVPLTSIVVLTAMMAGAIVWSINLMRQV